MAARAWRIDMWGALARASYGCWGYECGREGVVGRGGLEYSIGALLLVGAWWDVAARRVRSLSARAVF
eukprot:4445246-Prymnesium_polylepis.1